MWHPTFIKGSRMKQVNGTIAWFNWIICFFDMCVISLSKRSHLPYLHQCSNFPYTDILGIYTQCQIHMCVKIYESTSGVSDSYHAWDNIDKFNFHRDTLWWSLLQPMSFCNLCILVFTFAIYVNFVPYTFWSGHFWNLYLWGVTVSMNLHHLFYSYVFTRRCVFLLAYILN